MLLFLARAKGSPEHENSSFRTKEASHEPDMLREKHLRLARPEGNQKHFKGEDGNTRSIAGFGEDDMLERCKRTTNRLYLSTILEQVSLSLSVRG